MNAFALRGGNDVIPPQQHELDHTDAPLTDLLECVLQRRRPLSGTAGNPEPQSMGMRSEASELAGKDAANIADFESPLIQTVEEKMEDI